MTRGVASVEGGTAMLAGERVVDGLVDLLGARIRCADRVIESGEQPRRLEVEALGRGSRSNMPVTY